MEEWLYKDYKNIRDKNSELLNEVARLKKENAELKDDIEWYREKYKEAKAIADFVSTLFKIPLQK